MIPNTRSTERAHAPGRRWRARKSVAPHGIHGFSRWVLIFALAAAADLAPPASHARAQAPPRWFLDAQENDSPAVPLIDDSAAREIPPLQRTDWEVPPDWVLPDSPLYHAATGAEAATPRGEPVGDCRNPVLGFSPTPLMAETNCLSAEDAHWIYDDRYPVPTEQPWLQWGRPFYGAGMLPPGGTFFGPNNLLHPTFYMYGDFRTGIGGGRNAADSFANVAARLNLDMDLQLTSTERFHGFIGPLNDANQFTQASFQDGSVEYDSVLNPNLVNGFFEGDLGYMLGGLTNDPAEFDLPITAGLVPLFHQNGVWMDDAVTGVAIARNALHNRALNWSNYDVSLFAIFDQINSPAFGTDNHAAQAFGTAWFIDAYGGYIESGYAYVRDRHDQGRSYHNATVAFTRRYFDRIGNSVRLIVNTGQSMPERERTADGGLLILENNLITADSLRFVPYMNLFYGWGRPQSVARNALAGGILRNIGINYETDGLNGYPTLDATGNDTMGGAVGVNLLGAALEHQLVLEAAYLHAHGSDVGRIARGDQWGLGMRYQIPLSHCTLLRFDTMYGWRESDDDLYGGRAEFRYKF